MDALLMDHILYIIRKLILSGAIGVCLLCSMAMAGETSRPGKNILNSVIVYSRADTHSSQVATLNKNDVFQIKMELLNGSYRWCAINNKDDVFIGYALCNQLEMLKKRPPRHKPVKMAKSSKSTESGNAADLSKSVPPNENAATAPMIKENVSAPIKNFSSAKGTVNKITNTGISKKIIWLVFIPVFILLILLAYLIDVYKRNMSVKKSCDTADQAAKTDLSQEEKISGPEEATGSEATIEPVAAEEEKTVRADITEADSSDINEPVEFKFWDCVIKKADESTIGKLVKCQICGSPQQLAADFKCIECNSDMTYYIEVEQKHKT